MSNRIEMLTNLCCVVCGAKDEFGSAVVSRANVRNIGLIFDQNLGATEIAKLEDTAVRIKQQILGLDISMANALRVDVCKSSEKLVDVELDFKNRHRCLHLVEKAGCTVHSFGNKLLYEVEINFISLINPG